MSFFHLLIYFIAQGSGKTFAFLVPVISAIYSAISLSGMSVGLESNGESKTNGSALPHACLADHSNGSGFSTSSSHGVALGHNGAASSFAASTPAESTVDAVPAAATASLSLVSLSMQQQSQQSQHGTNNGGVQLRPRVSVELGRGCLPLAVALAPTRELASQILLDARRLTYNSAIKSVCVYGGNDLRQQLIELSTGCDLVVATPGRLNDLIDRLTSFVL